MADNKIKHLEFIHSTITRMSTNSFLLKGWSITLLAAIFALSEKESNKDFLIITYFSTILFWILSSYFLKIERNFRDLYNDVRKILDDDRIDFSMDISSYKNSLTAAFFSQTLLIFYAPQLISIIILKYLIK